MNQLLSLLHERNSAPRLREPAPNEAELAAMFKAAVRAPDHAWLQPWRFLVIAGEAREKLGREFEQALLLRTPDADETAREKARRAPLRAPLLVTAVCRYSEHPKVLREEQIISAGCAAHSLLLAAEAQGYAGIWRTGSYATDRHVGAALGLQNNEAIIGFLYFGSRDGQAKRLPDRKVNHYVSYWN